MTLPEIIAALEAADGPDESLDAALHAAIGKKNEPGTWTVYFYGDGPPRNQPNYTASLDAALTLVPDYWTAWNVRSRRRKTAFVAELTRMPEDGDDEESVRGYGSTPAIALCIAALKAQAKDMT